MSISTFETNLPNEIILKICHYLSWLDIVYAFYNLNTRINRTISEYFKHVSIGNDCCLKAFQYGCSVLLHHRPTLLLFIRTLTINNRGSPLAAKYFLSYIPIQDMIFLEKLVLVKFTGEEILSYFDVIETGNQNAFQYLVTLHICDIPYFNLPPCSTHGIQKGQEEYESIIINRVLSANKQRLKSIMVNNDDEFMTTNFSAIQRPCINIHTLSIMLRNGDELILLLTIVPNIRCLHVTLRHESTFESSLWSSIILPDLIELRLWVYSQPDWSLEDLMILLRTMPSLQRLLLSLATVDARLLDGQHVRKAISTAKILHLNDFKYAVNYGGSRLEHNLITNIPETWLPQRIAVTFNAKTNQILLHTIPFIFRRFWVPYSFNTTETSILKQKTISYYGESTHISYCNANIPWNLRDLCTIMERTSHIEHLTLYLPNSISKIIFGKYVKKYSGRVNAYPNIILHLIRR